MGVLTTKTSLVVAFSAVMRTPESIPSEEHDQGTLSALNYLIYHTIGCLRMYATTQSVSVILPEASGRAVLASTVSACNPGSRLLVASYERRRYRSLKLVPELQGQCQRENTKVIVIL